MFFATTLKSFAFFLACSAFTHPAAHAQTEIAPGNYECDGNLGIDFIDVTPEGKLLLNGKAAGRRKGAPVWQKTPIEISLVPSSSVVILIVGEEAVLCQP